jgi:fatty acid amide hydrolase
LAAAGVDVVEFQPPDVVEAMRLYFSLLSADGSRDARRLLTGSRKDPRIARLMRLARLPSPVRSMVSSVLGAVGHRHTSRLLRNTGAQSAAGYWKLCHERTAYAQHFWTAAQAQRIDAFLMPPFGVPAFRHGYSIEMLAAGSYAFLMNLLDAPAGVLPMTRVADGEAHASRNPRDYIERYAAQNQSGSQGLPVGVQVAAWPWREDIVLRLMHLLEAARGPFDSWP